MLIVNPEIIRTPVADDGILLLEPVTGKYFELNDTSALIYHCLEQELEFESIIKMVVNNFDIDEQTAQTDTQNLISDFTQHNILIHS